MHTRSDAPFGDLAEVPPPPPLPRIDDDEITIELEELGRGLERVQVGLLAMIALGVGVLVARTRRS